MPVRPAPLAEIQQTLGAAIPSLTTASAANDLYEAYLFSLIIQAARSERASAIRFQCISGGQASPFVFRTSPGYLNSRRADYGYHESLEQNLFHWLVRAGEGGMGGGGSRGRRSRLGCSAGLAARGSAAAALGGGIGRGICVKGTFTNGYCG